MLKKVTVGKTLCPSDDTKVTADKILIENSCGTESRIIKICSFLPAVTGTIRVKGSFTTTIVTNKLSSGSSSVGGTGVCCGTDKVLYDVIDGTEVTADNLTYAIEAPYLANRSKNLNPAGTTESSEGYADIDVTAGVPLTLLFYVKRGDYSSIYSNYEANVEIAYKEVEW